jgi:protein CpxP
MPGTIQILFNNFFEEGNPEMKPWIKRTLFGLFGVSLLVGGLTACGHRHGYGANATPEQAAEFRSKMVDRVSSKLDLDAAQKQKLTVLGDKLHEQRLAMMGASKDPRADLKALVAGDKFDKTRAQALVTEKNRRRHWQEPRSHCRTGRLLRQPEPRPAAEGARVHGQAWPLVQPGLIGAAGAERETDVHE